MDALLTGAWWAWAALFVAGGAALAWSRRERVLVSARVGLGEVVVRRREGRLEMVARGEREMVWSSVEASSPSRSGLPYVDLLHLAATAASSRKRALFLGCGGGVAPRQFAEVYPGIAIDVVELEPAVIELAELCFGLGAVPGVRLHVGDAAAFVRASRERWDVAVVDAYGAMVLPGDLARRELFLALRRRLSPGGAVAVNVVGPLGAPGPVLEVLSAMTAAFGEARVVPVIEPGERLSLEVDRNVVIIARRPP